MFPLPPLQRVSSPNPLQAWGSLDAHVVFRHMAPRRFIGFSLTSGIGIGSHERSLGYAVAIP